MGHGYVNLLDVEFFTPVSEGIVHELFCIIRDNDGWETEAIYYVVPYKPCNVLAGDLGQWLGPVHLVK